MRFMLLFTMSILCLVTGNAQINESSSLPEIEFSQLSQRDPNPLGEKALAIHPEQWKHAETEHFIYHFVHSYVATPISVEAEFHYRVVAKEIEREQSAGLHPDFTNEVAAMIPEAGWQAVMPFRIGYPIVDALESPRRPAEDVVVRS